jgi:PAS domain S-box-containing protein
MSASDMDQEKARLEQELRICRQIAFASGVFEDDVTTRTILESLAEGAVIIDNSGTILLVNAASERIFGYPREELIGKPHALLIPERLRKIHQEHEEHYFAEPKSRPMSTLPDLVGVRRDGSEFPLEISLAFINTMKGALVLALVSDLTLRQRASLLFRESDKLFHIQMERMKDSAMFTCDASGIVLDWNPGAERLEGYRAEEIVGENFSSFYSEEDRNAGKPQQDLVTAATEGQVEGERWRVRKDGSGFWADVMITALHDETGILRGFSEVTRNITERKNCETEIQDAREYAENIVETVREPLVVLASDLKVLTANHSFYDTFKVNQDETIGNFIYDLGNRQWDIPKLRVLLEEILPNERVLHGYQVEHDFLEIGRKTILLNAREIYRENIGSHIILLAMEDITDRRRAEDSLAEKRRELENLNAHLEERIASAVIELRQKDQMMLLEYRQAVLGQLINNIAHQWRQPLNALGLVIQQVPMYYQSGEFSMEFLKENTAKGMKLIQDMSRTIDGFKSFFRTDEKVITFSVNQVIARTLSLIEESFKNNVINITLHSEGDPLVNGYPNEYSQAVLNIMMNARDALVERKVADPRISLHIFAEGDKSVVTITDNAGGIADENLGRLFDPYFTTKGPDKGMGIGLYMSKTIIENNMKGSLKVSNTESGAEFRIEV